MEVVLDREELYQDVWSRRPSAVARKYCVDEGDIRRACFVLNVPRPERGYWAKLQRDDAPPVPPLPQKSGASTYTCRGYYNASKGTTSKPTKPAPIASKPERPVASSASGPKYITLHEWAEVRFSKIPHPNTLCRWVQNGYIQPRPMKVGRQWFVKPDAEYVD